MYKAKVSKILFTTLLLIAFIEFGVWAQGIKKCAAYGEYCQEHWECCSNSCLTYSYRCVGSKQPQPQLAAAAQKPSMTLDQLLDLTLQKTEPALQSPQQQHNQQQQNNLGLTLEELLVDNLGSGAVLGTVAPQLQNRFADVSPPQVGVRVDTAAGESANVTPAAAQCKIVGEKCYRHDECCTKLCHGYLHQCVT